MFLRSVLCLGLLFCSKIKAEYTQKSITGGNSTYLETCLKIVEDSDYFQNFRSLPEYAPILECGYVRELAEYLLENASRRTLSKLKACNRLERYGNPVTHPFKNYGNFSGTTLRYILVADQLEKLFSLPRGPKICEIGAGFGGQCFILSQFFPFSDYYVYDLPEVECLIDKMMNTLKVHSTHMLPIYATLPVEKIDLLISNYAFSELDLKTQLDYFERVVKKADRGYMLYNQISNFECLTAEEFIELLKANQMNPKLLEEPVGTYDRNVLIIWDRTKSI